MCGGISRQAALTPFICGSTTAVVWLPADESALTLRTIAQRPLHVIGEAYDTRCIMKKTLFTNHNISADEKKKKKNSQRFKGKENGFNK